MAEPRKTVTFMLPCPKCETVVEIQQTIEFETLETFQLEDDKVRMLYKVKSSIATEIHLCTGEKPIKELTGGTPVTIDNGQTTQVKPAPAEKKRALIVAPTVEKGETFLRSHRKGFEGWDVHVHPWWDSPRKIRGSEFHLTVVVGTMCPETLYHEARICTRLGDHPMVYTVHGTGTSIDPNRLISKPRHEL